MNNELRIMNHTGNLELKGRRVTVLGLGAHGGGVGAVRFLVERGAKVLVSDLKDGAALARPLSKLKGLPIRFSLGGHRPEIFDSELLIRNPGVPHTSPVLREAKRQGIPIMMESSLFFIFCPSSRVIGITGTKGKTTATLLLERVLHCAGKRVVAAGNFGRSMLEILPQVNAETWVVLELSSFQLEGLEAVRKSPHIAAITNLFSDHLDRYDDMQEYARAKGHIFEYQVEGDQLFLERSLAEGWSFSEGRANITFFKGSSRALVGCVAAHLGISVSPEMLEVEIPFRQQLVGEKGGVWFVNDSCATNPGATLFALEKKVVEHERFKGDVTLITGGTDKNLDYSKLTKRINEQEISVVLLSGSATEKIKCGLRRELILLETTNLRKVVRVAYSAARPDGVVLFSPAAASFELFVDEFDRGARFDEEVRDL